MKILNPLYCLTGLFLLSMGATAVAVGPPNGFALLDTLEPGNWQLRSTVSSEPLTKICLGKPEALIQIRHNGIACEQYVVRSAASSVTVSYTCKGRGQGLTTIRKESSKIIHIQSQGIQDNAPFSVTAEGRRTGPC